MDMLPYIPDGAIGRLVKPERVIVWRCLGCTLYYDAHGTCDCDADDRNGREHTLVKRLVYICEDCEERWDFRLLRELRAHRKKHHDAP